jgi:hypothetical protein
MKNLTIILALLLAATFAQAAEKKPIKEVDTDAFSTETMPSFSNVGDEHMALAWWIPNEFWEAIFARDTTTSEADKKSMMETLSGVSLLAVAQADISSLGAFDFYSKEEIQKTMQISFVDEKGNPKRLHTLQSIDPDLEIFLGVFKPILGAAMGNMGNNMHFYVLNDKGAPNGRVIDPYRAGSVKISLEKRSGDRMGCELELPLDILFVPRKCPNGKDAHVSWNYCPWTGTALKK